MVGACEHDPQERENPETVLTYEDAQGGQGKEVVRVKLVFSILCSECVYTYKYTCTFVYIHLCTHICGCI